MPVAVITFDISASESRFHERCTIGGTLACLNRFHWQTLSALFKIKVSGHKVHINSHVKSLLKSLYLLGRLKDLTSLLLDCMVDECGMPIYVPLMTHNLRRLARNPNMAK